MSDGTINGVGNSGVSKTSFIKDGSLEGVIKTLRSAASKALSSSSEDELVEIDSLDDSISLSGDDKDDDKMTNLDVLQKKRDIELDKYFRYQEKISNFEERKAKYQSKLDSLSADSNLREMYQSKISNLDSFISSAKQKCSSCESKLSSIASKITEEMQTAMRQEIEALDKQLKSNSSTGSNASGISVPGGTSTAGSPSIGSSSAGNAASTNGNFSSNATGASNVNLSNTTYTGESIPSDIAARLDKKLGSGFSKKCESVAAYLGCNANDLLGMMYSESGINPKARNKSSNAVGLIQFMPSTLKANGYTTEQVASMSATQQLDVVADIFMKAKKMAGYGENQKIDGGTLYAINWLPAYAKKDTLTTKGGKYYSSGLDMNKDGSVTKADLSQRLNSKYNEMKKYI